VRLHKLCEVIDECTVHNNSVLAIFVLKIINVSGNLTKLCQNQFWLFFEIRCRIGCDANAEHRTMDIY